MKKVLFLINILVFCITYIASGQNIILNNDFDENGGSLNSWTYTTGTTLANINGANVASIAGENGVLYQKITNITPGKPYVCSINFKSIVAKQTTGYGYAVEKGVPLIVPTFTSGATNLKDFCTNNSGSWTVLPGITGAIEADGSETKNFDLIIPADAKAIYIGIATKGAAAKLEVNSVTFQTNLNTKDVSFVVKDVLNKPVGGAEIKINGLSNPIFTDATGKAKVTLTINANVNYTVLKDYFQLYSGKLLVTENTIDVPITLSGLVQVKDVQTRISEYGDNATPYPIYAHFWNSGLNFTPEMNQKIVTNFDYIIGGGDVSGIANSTLNVNALKAIDPKFQVINYQGGWGQKASSLIGQEMNLLYYRVGTLGTALDATTTSFVINAPSDSKGKGLVASEANNYTTWIRIGNELMKLTYVSSKTIYPITVNVERGLRGTTPTNHLSDATITAPLYTVAPIEGGNNANLSYFDPVFGARKNRLKSSTINFATSHNVDGIWIDILLGFLEAKNMIGGTYTLWNHEKESLMSSQDIVFKTKDAMKEVYESFYARMGYYPVIYGNNVLYDLNYTTSSRAFAMEKTTEHPRGLDGFCHENSWGHMSDVSGNVDNDGNPVSSSDIFRVAGKNNNGRFLEWYMENTWINNCKAIALLAQKELPNQPMTINAGFKNQWFAADLTNELRYSFNKYCYASYLLSVHVDSQNKISSRMGISPMTVDASGKLDVNIEPFFTYDIGIPVQTNVFTNFTSYRVGTNNLYARKFSKGLVLVNPFSTNMSESVLISDITGNTTDIYRDPENNNQIITTVSLNSRESRLLLKESILSLVSDEATIKSISIYPNPANNQLIVNFGNNKTINSQNVKVFIFNTKGALVSKTKSTKVNHSINLNISNLAAGSYVLKIDGIKENIKFIKN